MSPACGNGLGYGTLTFNSRLSLTGKGMDWPQICYAYALIFVPLSWDTEHFVMMAMLNQIWDLSVSGPVAQLSVLGAAEGI